MARFGLDLCMYISAINKLLGWSCTALVPDLLELSQVWMLIITTLILDGLYRIDKADLTSSPLLVTRVPVVLPIKSSTWDDGNAGHTGRCRQHGRAAVATKGAMYNFASLSFSIIVLLQQLLARCPFESLEAVSRCSYEEGRVRWTASGNQALAE